MKPFAGIAFALLVSSPIFALPAAAQDGPDCGPNQCATGEVCCNESCGICTPPDGSCVDLFCPEPQLVLTFGVRGGMNLNLLSEPAEEPIDLPVSSFTGIGGGGGVSIQGLFRDIVGLETGLLYVSASGAGDISFPGGFSVDQDLSSSELHIPLLLKLQAPLDSAKPYLGLGATFVIQTAAEFTVDQEFLVNSIDTSVETLSYTMLTAAIGVAIDLDVVRIPVEFRANYQSLDDDPLERTTFAPTTGGNLTALGVLPNWESQIFLLVGVDYVVGL